MTYQEKASITENCKEDSIVIFKQGGLFYDCVNESAYYFCKYFKKSNVLVENSKANKEPILRIGIRREYLFSYIEGKHLHKIEEKDDIILLVGPFAYDEEGYTAWRNEILEEVSQKEALAVSGIVSEKSRKLPLYSILEEIQGIDVSSITPLEGLSILSKIKSDIRGIDVNFLKEIEKNPPTEGLFNFQK